jgi:hypothetical protein
VNLRLLVCDGEVATAASVVARQWSPVSSVTASERVSSGRFLNQCPRGGRWNLEYLTSFTRLKV